MKRAYFIAALSAALSAAPTANEDFVVAEAAAAYSNAVYTAGTNTTAATTALDESLSSRLSLASRDATNYTDKVAGQVRAAIPTDNAQLANGAGYVTAAITNGLHLTETDPTVPAWAKAASAPLPPNYATVSNKAMTALQSYTETDPAFSAWADAHVVAGGSMVDWAIDALYAMKLGDGFSTTYSAEDITTISNGFAAADESLSSRLSLASLAATNYTDFAIGAAIDNTNPVFSNAVLSVGLGVDTNTVAAINALVEAGDELPIGGATSVGALLLALAAAIAALKKRLPYALVAKTIENGAVTLDDRASNTVEISATLSPNTLTVNFPATSGKARDFALRLNIASGVTAPELVLPQGVVCENADGKVPEISDGGTGGSSTILYFSETENNGTTAKFLLKGETLAAITQA